MTEKRSLWTYTPIVVITAIFCCVLWGSASPAIKIAYELFEIPASDTPSRLMLAGVMKIVFCSLSAVFLFRLEKYSGKKVLAA
ncbi:hypothetical protein [Butyrivibrio sp. XBB1001]|uniref:hypothetical protein n=1 Tax=Butyrivibrio sp. XBB1001 TaxID=1280682 RepID=UPI0004005274|nr:hypothetical protein [Butyrivibrio sp. XBB1001]